MRSYSSYRYFGAFRLLLATSVVMQHFLTNVAPEPLATNSMPYEIGSVAVGVFFALSGYVISEAADRVYQQRPIAFLMNRLLRIAPHFVLAVSATIAACAFFIARGTLRLERGAEIAPAIALAPTNIIANLFNFLPGLKFWVAHNFMMTAWAIHVEMLFYFVIMASIAASLALKTWFNLKASMFSISLGMAALMMPLFLLATAGRATNSFQFVPHFVFGASLCVIVIRPQKLAFAAAAIGLIGIVAQFFMLPPHHPEFGYERAVIAEFGWLVFLLALMTALAFARFSRLEELDRYLGDLTYPLYMWHPGVMLVILSMTDENSYAGLAGGLLLSLATSLAAHHLVDPAVDRLRDFVRGRRLDRASGSAARAQRATSIAAE
jgi:peptidoglycan/LPS O-acetylase OafA/YrhL